MASTANFLILEFTAERFKVIEKFGSVRVDLLGGTLDLPPIHTIIPKVVTLNLATSLKAHVKITATKEDGIRIISKDYQSDVFIKNSEFCDEAFQKPTFGALQFIAEILFTFNLTKNYQVELESGSPPGAGLGGSSAMGVTLFSALSDLCASPLKNLEDKRRAIKIVNSIEAKMLNSGPAGYQDYYPALFGGVLALTPDFTDTKIEQLYSDELKSFLENHITLIYSGQGRLSGINNWEVYKAFFDQDEKVVTGLRLIAELSHRAYQAIKENDYAQLLQLIGLEGLARQQLFPRIVSPEMDSLYNELKARDAVLGMKVCGAGGGGCFLLTHRPDQKQEIEKQILSVGMKPLTFEVVAPA
jgi:D-glycero-alpha-D-manno-heptose-7-phosphate kinase